MKSISYTSSSLLSCAPCGGAVILCIKPGVTDTGVNFIDGNLITYDTQVSCSGCPKYVYGFTYENSLYFFEGHELAEGDITGVICSGCLTDWVKSKTSCTPCTDPTICIHPYFYPECYGALGNDVHDDSYGINAAIAAAVNAGGGTVFFSSGKNYKVESTILIPFTAKHVTLLGYGAYITGAVDGNIIKISDTVSQNGHAYDINLLGLWIYGDGPASVTYPNQNGIEIDAVVQCSLKDITIYSIPNIGIIGTKSLATGATYWNKVEFNNTQVRFCGKKGLEIGTNSAGDDLSISNCLFNHLGDAIASNFPDAGVHINVVTLDMRATEVSGIYSTQYAGFGYRWGVRISNASGIVSGMHYELNGNDQPGSADILLDANANGLCLIGSEHFGSDVTGAKFCIQTSSKDNYITGVTWAGAIAHTYDYIVEAINAENLNLGTIKCLNTPQVGPNFFITNLGGFGKAVIDTHDGYVTTGRRREKFQTKYNANTPAQIVLGAGWGTTAAVSACEAYDSHGDFTITSSGTGQASATATIDVTFADGPYDAVPTLIFYQRNHNATDAILNDIIVNPYDHGFNIGTDTIPVATRTYNFSWILVGM